jgi:ABC-2 type transport system permease protein
LSGGQFDAGATLLLVVAALLLIALASVAFRFRDLGASIWHTPAGPGRALHRASENVLLEVPVLSGLYEQRVALAVWAIGMALGAIFTVQLTKPMVAAIPSIPAISAYLGGVTQNLAQAYIGVVWFGIAQLLAAAFAITQVARWAADDSDGRLEMVLAEGVPRWRVVLERTLALFLAEAWLSAAGGIVTFMTAQSIGIRLDVSRVLLASGLLVVLGLAFGLVGSALASFRPRLTVVAMSIFAITGYLLVQFVPLFRWPDWLSYLSFFKLYGAPLANGLYVRGFEIMVAVAVAAFALSLAAIARRDLAR